MFSTLSKTKIIILANFILSSATAFNLDQSRILLFGKEFKATFQLSYAASLNLGQSQNGVLGNGLNTEPQEILSRPVIEVNLVSFNSQKRRSFSNGFESPSRNGFYYITTLVSDLI